MPLAAQADEYIGSRISFLFYPGWEEPEQLTGWLHGSTSPADEYKTWLHISDEPTLPVDEDKNSLGGYAIANHESFDVIEAAHV